MVLFCISFLFASLAARSSVRLYRVHHRSGGNPGNPPRIGHLGTRHLLFQLVCLAGIGSAWILGDWHPSDLGWKGQLPWTCLAFPLGFVLYLPFCVVLALGLILVDRRSEFEDICFQALRTVWPRERVGKVRACVAICILNPITEEIVYRGVLLYALGQALGNYTLAVIVSLTFTMLAHLYQSPLALLGHLLFFVFATAILFSPLGLEGAIGFHFAGDLVPVITFKQQLILWRARHRPNTPHRA